MTWNLWTNPGFLVWLIGVVFATICSVALNREFKRFQKEVADRRTQRELDDTSAQYDALVGQTVEDQEWA